MGMVICPLLEIFATSMFHHPFMATWYSLLSLLFIIRNTTYTINLFDIIFFHIGDIPIVKIIWKKSTHPINLFFSLAVHFCLHPPHCDLSAFPWGFQGLQNPPTVLPQFPPFPRHYLILLFILTDISYPARIRGRRL